MFIVGKPALVIDKTLVIADLHIGITRALYESGISMPSQVRKMADKIHELKKIMKAKELVIAGDVKHKVPGISWQEIHEVPEFLAALRFKKITIVKGNHDGQIEKLIPDELKARVKVRKAVALGDYCVTHGHRKANTKKNIIIAHNHPHVRFRDELGAVYTEPVWVRGIFNEKEIIIMPAFNELCGATIVNRDKLLGPIAKRIMKAHAYLLDGTDLGLIKDLKIK
ncbi:MAG: metallophosphoesterase [Candidatus Aenigmarchaeota archaeon]|nr:metallophosphoesterase [Candidatus Aenigmarchaeota archaeon]